MNGNADASVSEVQMMFAMRVATNTSSPQEENVLEDDSRLDYFCVLLH